MNALDDKISSLMDIIEKESKESKWAPWDDFHEYIKKINDIRIESTNLCGYACAMCPRNTMSRARGIQSMDDFNFVIRNIEKYRIDYDGRFQLHDFGEALLDENLSRKIKLLRDKFINCHIDFHSTIGYELSERFFDDLVENGLNAIIISCYGIDGDSYMKIHGVDRFDLVMHNMAKLSKIVKINQNKFSVMVKGPFRKTDFAAGDDFSYIPDADVLRFRNIIVNHGFDYFDTTLHNYGKLDIDELTIPLSPCSIYDGALSHVLNINWDLKIVPCCMVTDQEIVLGDLRDKSLYENFYGESWSAFRNAHKIMNLRSKYPYCWKCHQDENSFMR